MKSILQLIMRLIERNMRKQILKIFRAAIFLKFHFANRKIAKNIAPVFYLKVNQRQRIGFLRLNKGKKNT